MQCRSSNCCSGNTDTTKMQQFAAGPAISKVLCSNATMLQHTYVCVTASHSIQEWQQQQQPPAWHRAQSADQVGPSAVSSPHLHASRSAPAWPECSSSSNSSSSFATGYSWIV
ncbi:TPA: hypothetical protein ACH3X3_006935 [Trebouxia sp. C0006]